MSGLARARRGPEPVTQGLVHILTCGSVDDGKSTLIGRLLWDISGLPADERERVRKAARASGNPDNLDYSLLLDGLVAEREQGITIDIAWRYMDTPRRRVVLIDSPGHDQYTRNMASGASHADAAIMLIDARHGIKPQTRRHAAILQLMGVPRVVLAVNKMDLLDWSETRFREIERDFAAAIAPLGFKEALAIPVSAREGGNVAAPSQNTPWYEGPVLAAHLEGIPSRLNAGVKPFRMPVQTVLRDGQDFRGLAGTVSSGIVRVGDSVADVLTGRSARVARIATMDGDLAEAARGKAVALVLDTDIDVARGAVLAPPDALPAKARRVEGRIVWVSDQPLGAAHGLLFRTATDLVPVAGLEVTGHVDLETLSLKPAKHCAVNDIAAVSITLSRPVALDAFAGLEETGAFLLTDALSGATLAAGVAVTASEDAGVPGALPGSFVLTRQMLASGLCSDLGQGEADGREFGRRTQAALELLSAAGVSAFLED